MSERAVVCVSGGMDSLTALAYAMLKHDVILMHVDYGQLTEAAERKSCGELVHWYKIPTSNTYYFKTDVLQKVGTSCITDRGIEVPADGVRPDVIPVSYVPFRNGNILAMAAALAQATGARYIYTGFVEEDSSGYPDCREVFVEAFQRAISEGLRPETAVEIVSPVIHMTKTEVIKAAIMLKAPLQLTWSCYAREDSACGVCDSCRLRIKGFSEMGMIDPIPYVLNVIWPKNCQSYNPIG